MILILPPFLIASLFNFLTFINYRWRILVSKLVARRFSCSPGHVFIGSDCIILGHKYICLHGRFVMLSRNRIEVIDKHGDITFNPRLSVGENVSMEYDCHIGCINEVHIGARVLIASRVYISDHSHGATEQKDLLLPPNKRAIFSKGPVIIEDDVWLGEGVAVLPGVRVGRASIIGANSVVTRDIPPYSVAVGAPARVIKTFDCLSAPIGGNFL